MSSYRLAPIFLIRMAGVAFDAMEGLATAGAAALAREMNVKKRQFNAAKKDAEFFFQSGERQLTEDAFRALRHAVRVSEAPAGISETQPPVFRNYSAAAMDLAAAKEDLHEVLFREVGIARAALLAHAQKFLPRQLMFNTGAVRELLKTLAVDPEDGIPLAPRNCRAGERERHLLLYLQRVCTKNDSFSEFGPTGWGLANKAANLLFSPIPGIAARETFLERWTAHQVAAAMNADPEVFQELAPRLLPTGRIQKDSFFFCDTGEVVKLEAGEKEILERCRGATPVRSLGAAQDQVRLLVEKRLLLCRVEVPAMEPHAFRRLMDDVEHWGPGRTRDRWLSLLRPIAELPRKFAEADATAERQQILQEARARLTAFGEERKSGSRSLYAALNPIGEECFRDCRFTIPDSILAEVPVQAAPWIDLWRDSYAFVASRVAAGLRSVLQKIPVLGRAVPLPAFLAACEQAGIPLAGPGLVGLAHTAFQEVKTGFQEMIGPHSDKVEYELTSDDCHFVRRNFDYPRFDEYTYPSADLQLSASSMEAVNRGEYQWLLAELHPPAALLHHGAYWSCPDHAALNQAFAESACDKPSFHFGFSAADFTAHTTVRLFDALPELATFVAPQRGNPKWKTVRPADAEVYVDDNSGDVCLRHRETGAFLGSFARAWLIPLGFHPFQFGFAPHTPRLRCGNVIVQRRSWTVRLDEFPAGDYTGVSAELVLAIEELRASKGWPRHIYIRPTEQALRRSGGEGRDKDTKPVFIDLESYLFLEIFYRWLKKSGELEVTEMLPDADHLPWQEADGRRTFELRTLIVPRS